MRRRLTVAHPEPKARCDRWTVLPLEGWLMEGQGIGGEATERTDRAGRGVREGVCKGSVLEESAPCPWAEIATRQCRRLHEN